MVTTPRIGMFGSYWISKLTVIGIMMFAKAVKDGTK